MTNSGYGRIINITSGAGLYGNFGQANYSAGKMGILGLSKTLAKEGEKYNVMVNCIAPIAASQMTAALLPLAVLKELKPEHIVPLVTYLASADCRENGGIFEAGGGWYSKLRWERSAGVKLGEGDSCCSAEDIAKHFTAISDFSRETSSYPTDAIDAIRVALSTPKPFK